MEVRGPGAGKPATVEQGKLAKVGAEKSVSSAHARTVAEKAFDAVFLIGGETVLATAGAGVEPLSPQVRLEQARELFSALQAEFLHAPPSGEIADAHSEMSGLLAPLQPVALAPSELLALQDEARADPGPADARAASDDVLDRFWGKLLDRATQPSKQPPPAMSSPAVKHALQQLAPIMARMLSLSANAAGKAVAPAGDRGEARNRADSIALTDADARVVQKGLSAIDGALSSTSVDVETMVTLVMMELSKENKIDLRAMALEQSKRIAERRAQRELLGAMKKERLLVEQELLKDFHNDVAAKRVDPGCSFADYAKARVVVWARIVIDPETHQVVKETESRIVEHQGAYPPGVALKDDEKGGEEDTGDLAAKVAQIMAAKAHTSKAGQRELSGPGRADDKRGSSSGAGPARSGGLAPPDTRKPYEQYGLTLDLMLALTDYWNSGNGETCPRDTYPSVDAWLQSMGLRKTAPGDLAGDETNRAALASALAAATDMAPASDAKLKLEGGGRSAKLSGLTQKATALSNKASYSDTDLASNLGLDQASIKQARVIFDKLKPGGDFDKWMLTQSKGLDGVVNGLGLRKGDGRNNAKKLLAAVNDGLAGKGPLFQLSNNQALAPAGFVAALASAAGVASNGGALVSRGGGVVAPPSGSAPGGKTEDKDEAPPLLDPLRNLSGEDRAQAMSLAQFDLKIEGAQQKLDTLGDQSQEEQLRMQQLLERYQKCFDIMSNTMKKASQTQDNIIGNMK